MNVCLFRWKSGGSIFFPPSTCSNCKTEIRWFDNIPVISFFVLKGQCRHCGIKLSWQYPIVEFVTGLLFTSCAFFAVESVEVLFASFVFVSFLVLLVASDLNWKLLPHPFTNFFIVSGLLVKLAANGLNLPYFFMVVGGFVVIGAIVFGLIHIFPEVLGGGDIKMMLALSIWLGAVKAVYVLLIAFGVGTLVALVLLGMKKLSRKSTMPFGPFLAVGAMLMWFCPGLFEHLRMGA